jgi:hypothetical protein
MYFSVRKRSSIAVEEDPAGIEPGEIAVGDFNNDNRPDIFVFDVPNPYNWNGYADTQRSKKQDYQFKSRPGCGQAASFTCYATS